MVDLDGFEYDDNGNLIGYTPIGNFSLSVNVVIKPHLEGYSCKFCKFASEPDVEPTRAEFEVMYDYQEEPNIHSMYVCERHIEFWRRFKNVTELPGS